MRWLAVVGQVITILAVDQWLAIPLPWPRMAGVLAFLIVLNLLSWLRQRRGSQITGTELFLELLLDVAALTVQLYLSGGAANPFISLYLLQVILGTVLLDSWAVWLLVAITSGCFILLTVIYQPLPHVHSSDFFNLHLQGMFLCFVLAAGLLVFFVMRIQRNLRARDRHLADLRQRAAEEDHVVRLGLLASGAAHELGTPLATLSVILSDWRQMPELTGKGDLQADLAEMQAQIDRCKAIISETLVAAGDVRGEGAQRTSLIPFLDETINGWQASRAGVPCDYRNHLHRDQPVIADLALRQLLWALLDNAADASPAGMAVVIRRDGDWLLITVSDQGPGFPPAMLADFGRPYQSSKSRPGRGLGLYLAVNVARKLGGHLTARNQPDGGAMVALALPLAALASGEHDDQP